jgi:hypothetical protein
MATKETPSFATETTILLSKIPFNFKTTSEYILNPFSLSGILKMLFFSLARQIIQA